MPIPRRSLRSIGRPAGRAARPPVPWATRAAVGGGAERFLRFEVGPHHCALGAAFLLEVAQPEGLRAVAGFPQGECLAFSHRGFSIPAIDLRVLFGLPAGPRPAAARVLVGEVGREPFGLLVDRVGDIQEIDPRAILALPEGASRVPAACFRGIAGREDRVLLVLDAGGLATLECVGRFGGVAAVPGAATA